MKDHPIFDHGKPGVHQADLNFAGCVTSLPHGFKPGIPGAAAGRAVLPRIVGVLIRPVARFDENPYWDCWSSTHGRGKNPPRPAFSRLSLKHPGSGEGGEQEQEQGGARIQTPGGKS